VCVLTNLFDVKGECASGPCSAREMAYLALHMGKANRYFPTLSQWYSDPDFKEQRWDVDTLRSMTYVFDLIPKSSDRFSVDKDFRKFPPATVIGSCPICPDDGAPDAAGTPRCKPHEPWQMKNAQDPGHKPDCKPGENWPIPDNK